MRSFSYFCLLLSTLLIHSACHKSAGRPPFQPDTIFGAWELRTSSGSAGQSVYSSGNGNVLDYSGNSYSMYRSHQLFKSGQFSIVYDTTIENNVCLVFPSGAYTSRIIYDGDTSATKIFYEVKNNQLTFYSGCYALDGGHSEMYQRITSPSN